MVGLVPWCTWWLWFSWRLQQTLKPKDEKQLDLAWPSLVTCFVKLSQMLSAIFNYLLFNPIWWCILICHLQKTVRKWGRKSHHADFQGDLLFYNHEVAKNCNSCILWNHVFADLTSLKENNDPKQPKRLPNIWVRQFVFLTTSVAIHLYCQYKHIDIYTFS